MATMYDICRKTGLSSATVSRVVNGKPNTSERSRKLVAEAIKELHYEPNMAARMLAGMKAGMIGVLLPDIANGFYVQVLRGIEDAVQEAGMHQIVTFCGEKKSFREVFASMASGGLVDVLVVMNSMLTDREMEELKHDKTPLVLIGGESQQFDVVRMDNDLGAYAAVKHLLGSGCRDILLISGPEDNPDNMQRKKGVERALREAGIDWSAIRLESGNFSVASGAEAMTRILESGDPVPDAVFALNDSMALGVMEVLSARGLRMPDDVSVVGFDDCEGAPYAGLTTVYVPMREIGYEAARLAIRRIDEPSRSAPTTMALATELIRRKSVR